MDTCEWCLRGLQQDCGFLAPQKPLHNGNGQHTGRRNNLTVDMDLRRNELWSKGLMRGRSFLNNFNSGKRR